MRHVVITGAASGIGAETCRVFREAGDKVYGLDVRECAHTCDVPIHCNLSSEHDVNKVLDDLGGLDIDVIVLSAGLPGNRKITDILEVNFFRQCDLADALLSRMKAGGSVVAVSSGAGFLWQARLEILKQLIGLPIDQALIQAAGLCANGSEAYTLSKELLNAWVMCRAIDNWRNEIRFNAVSPGGVDTAIQKDFRESMGEIVDWAAKTFGRHAEVNEIAAPIFFLASSHARWINGADIPIDAGLVAGIKTGLLVPPQSS